MRIITWNMGRSRRTSNAAWHYLLSHLKPDIALVQEALASSVHQASAHGSLIWSSRRSGGTGIFIRSGIDFEPVEAPVKGSYVAGISTKLSGKGTRVLSVHVGPESWANQKALEPWLIEQVNAAPCVVGGDFNTSRHYASKHKLFFDRLLAAGVHDCHWSKHGREVPSFWGRQTRTAKYQDDHFFTSQSLAGFVSDCDVVDNPLTRLLSDHGPVVLSLSKTRG